MQTTDPTMMETIHPLHKTSKECQNWLRWLREPDDANTEHQADAKSWHLTESPLEIYERSFLPAVGQFAFRDQDIACFADGNHSFGQLTEPAV